MPGRERYDLAFSFVLGMGDHQIMKDLVDEVLANALNELVEQHVIEEWQVSADSTDLDGQIAEEDIDQAIADRMNSMELPAAVDLTAPPAADPRTQKDEPDQ